jgi:hypothetical protein
MWWLYPPLWDVVWSYLGHVVLEIQYDMGRLGIQTRPSLQGQYHELPRTFASSHLVSCQDGQVYFAKCPRAQWISSYNVATKTSDIVGCADPKQHCHPFQRAPGKDATLYWDLHDPKILSVRHHSHAIKVNHSLATYIGAVQLAYLSETKTARQFWFSAGTVHDLESFCPGLECILTPSISYSRGFAFGTSARIASAMEFDIDNKTGMSRSPSRPVAKWFDHTFVAAGFDFVLDQWVVLLKDRGGRYIFDCPRQDSAIFTWTLHHSLPASIGAQVVRLQPVGSEIRVDLKNGEGRSWQNGQWIKTDIWRQMLVPASWWTAEQYLQS